ncbi:unnamed protein product [Peronospora belbahrii]|uniref:sphingomyelin phosphodiesterase n=1 Tax=Peronospora belbahrii TaxID=622444 RepID=A0AAU9L8X6_9STRA|nr:unnamed protein product [Peronospora belbahrii]
MPLALLTLVPPLLLYAVQGHFHVDEMIGNVPVWSSRVTPYHVKSAPDSTISFEVLQYNLFGRPYEVSKDGQSERLQRVPESLHQISPTIDVVTLAEADIKTERNEMLAQFQKFGFNYSTTILHDPDPFTSLLNGGVMVVSKWPIIREAQHVYHNACHYSDCLAAKGVKYARLLKTVNDTHKIFNVFATHMQAWSTPERRADRIQQAKQMRQFIDAIGIPYHEPLIFAGDFNVDNHTFGNEVAHLVELLQANEPRQIGKQVFTSDPHTNVLVGRDGAAISNKCFAQYVQNWGPATDSVFYPSLLTRTTCGVHTEITEPDLDNMCYCPCCPLEWLDYVLYGKAPYQQPSTVPTLQAFVNQVPRFTVGWTGVKRIMKMALIDLSDHYPVHGKFEFPLTRGQGKEDDPFKVAFGRLLNRQ